MIDLSQYADSDMELFPSGKLFRITFDPVTVKFRILSTEPSFIEHLSETYSCDNVSAFYSKQYGYDAEDKIYIVNKFGYFPVGFLFEVLQYVKRMYGTISCIAISNNCKRFIDTYLKSLTPFTSGLDAKNFELSNIALDSGANKRREAAGLPPYILRDYQINAIKYLIFKGSGRGLIELPTSSGKSFVIANFIYNLETKIRPGLKYLIFVPNKQLVEQFYSDLADYGYDMSKVTRFTSGLKKKDAFNPDAQIIISNRQYIFPNVSKLPKIDAIICDEVHQIAPKSSTFDFVNSLNCGIKIGCSGTVPKDKYRKWTLMGLIGNLLYAEDIVDLQSRGFITKLKISVVDITDKTVESNRDYLFNLNPNRRYSASNEQTDDEDSIAFNDSYNEEISYITNNFIHLYSPILDQVEKETGNVLVLFDRIEFGKGIFELAKERKLRNSKILYIDGSVDVKIREEIRASLENSNDNILFANVQILSTGINIKNLNTIVFNFSSKSTSRIIQSIGRALRLHKDKATAHLIDCRFNFKYSRKHFRERLKMYRDTYHKKPDEVIKITV